MLIVLLIMVAASCNDKRQAEHAVQKNTLAPGSFQYDLAFLKKYDSVVVLEAGDARVIVSPKYQGKVFTSTGDADSGRSFGWIHYKAFDAPLDPHINAYGGENRLWLGPEGGKYALFFSPGSNLEFANWKTPAEFDSEPWEVLSQDARSVQMEKQMQLLNFSGTHLSITVRRSVQILKRSAIDSLLELGHVPGIKPVGYATENVIVNNGHDAWTDQGGTPCLWILDMFPPSDSTTIVIPIRQTKSTGAVSTDYFGTIPGNRLVVKDSVVYFKADGRMRGKLGIAPLAAKPVAGSYDAKNKVLTIALYDVHPYAKYMNQQWKLLKNPFAGDAMNAYNDGPLEDGRQLGPFYELESVSRAALLQPGQSITHTHSVFHFTGENISLDYIAKKILGVSIHDMETVFK